MAAHVWCDRRQEGRPGRALLRNARLLCDSPQCTGWTARRACTCVTPRCSSQQHARRSVSCIRSFRMANKLHDTTGQSGCVTSATWLNNKVIPLEQGVHQHK